ncbi:MAG: hypothetical protein JKY60_10075 [Kordiimonadaceae bacterium]|nr:hypothetical protein [Kordiimonadaceae bacterium]
MSKFSIIAILALVMLLQACSSTPKRPYDWSGRYISADETYQVVDLLAGKKEVTTQLAPSFMESWYEKINGFGNTSSSCKNSKINPGWQIFTLEFGPENIVTGTIKGEKNCNGPFTYTFSGRYNNRNLYLGFPRAEWSRVNEYRIENQGKTLRWINEISIDRTTNRIRRHPNPWLSGISSNNDLHTTNALAESRGAHEALARRASADNHGGAFEQVLDGLIVGLDRGFREMRAAENSRLAQQRALNSRSRSTTHTSSKSPSSGNKPNSNAQNSSSSFKGTKFCPPRAVSVRLLKERDAKVQALESRIKQATGYSEKSSLVGQMNEAEGDYQHKMGLARAKCSSSNSSSGSTRE